MCVYTACVCVCVCVCTAVWGGMVVICLSEPQLLCLWGGSAGYLWKAFFENKTRTKLRVFLVNQSLNFYKTVSSEV